MWGLYFNQAIDAIAAADEKDRHSGGALAVKSDVRGLQMASTTWTRVTQVQYWSTISDNWDTNSDNWATLILWENPEYRPK